jgi:uncharacterized membrane protein YphA (DoxX/SURF4 family)
MISYARVLFGVSAVVSGAVSLMWHDSALWQQLNSLWLPLRTATVWCVSIAEIAGGIGIMFPSAARISSIVLGAVFAYFSLSTVPGMITAPVDPGSYVDFFEQLSMAIGAIAFLLGPRIARLGLGVCALSFAWAQVVYFKYTASLVPTWIPPNQSFWTTLTTIAFALAAVAMLINVRALLAMQFMALMMALFGVLVWVPHIITQPALPSNWIEISGNYLMTAATLLVAATLDNWPKVQSPT